MRNVKKNANLPTVRRWQRRQRLKVAGSDTRNWPTRPLRTSRVKKINAADLSADQRSRYGI
jgi:hypothetical protein